MPLPTDQLLTPAAYRQFFDHPKSEFLKGILPTLEDVLARNLAGDRNWQLDGWKSAIASLPEHSAPEPAFREGVVCLDGNSSRDSSASKQAVDLRRNSPAPDAAGRTDGYSNSLPDADTGPREIDAIRTAGADSPADLPAVSPGSTTGPADVTAAPRKHLRKLMPWRKGPWQIFGVDIDTEWRSDWKWDRVLPVIDNLKGRRVLDIGCGNGYHLWRMYREGADAAVGIEPHLLNVAQFAVMQRSFPGFPVTVLPMPLEEYPVNTRIYDTVFSMGVLYHRKSPVDHLLHCKSCLREGGQFVLETLVVEGDVDTLLVPEDRYAKMRNVWTIPSPAHLERLLRRVGFRNIRLMDVNQTSLEEQRATEWMEFESLADFLDPTDRDRTVEGYPAPRRALFVCEAP